MELEVSTALTSEVETESWKKWEILFRIAFIVGVVGLIAYIVIAVIAFGEEKEPLWLEIELWASALIFALGLVIPLTVKNMIKKSLVNIQGVTNRYQFYEDYLITTSYRGEEKIAEAKNYYSEITKIRLTEHYVYLHLGIRGAYPIARSALSKEQQSWLLSLKNK